MNKTLEAPGVTMVAGGASGLGRAVTTLLVADERFDVVLAVDKERALLEKLAGEVEEAGSSLETYPADLTNHEEVVGAFEFAGELGRLANLVSCVGVGANTVSNTARPHWDRVIAANLIAPMDCCNEAALRMGRSKGGDGGRIVVVGSLCVRAPDTWDALYAAPKGGLARFIDIWRREVAGEGIDVISFNPGGMATPMDKAPEEKKALAVERGELMQPEGPARLIVQALVDENVMAEVWYMAPRQAGLLP